MSLNVTVKQKNFRQNDGATNVLADVSFDVAAGSIVCLYGPSGCGKSTLLRIIAGLDFDYTGQVTLDGLTVTQPTRDVGMTVQTNVSYDWLTVAGNIAFGLRYASNKNSWTHRVFGIVDKEKARDEVVRLASIVGLSFADLGKYPEEISGGMKQRMAFARALLTNPKVLLLDEPFSSLDFESRQSLQDVVLRVRKELGTSFVCVSHDPEEVLYLADEIMILGGNPTTVVQSLRPDLPYKDSEEKRYTPEFQQEKKKLHEWLNTVKGLVKKRSE